jgi:hypothetical protein
MMMAHEPGLEFMQQTPEYAKRYGALGGIGSAPGQSIYMHPSIQKFMRQSPISRNRGNLLYSQK